jgi:hypothetical protein
MLQCQIEETLRSLYAGFLLDRRGPSGELWGGGSRRHRDQVKASPAEWFEH